MLEHDKASSQFSPVTDMTKAAAAIALEDLGAADPGQTAHVDSRCRCSASPEMKLDVSRTALVVIDPHTDLLSREGAAWSALGESGEEHETIRNLGRLFRASKSAGVAIAISLTAKRFGRSGFMPELKQYIDDESTIFCSPHKRYSPLPRVNDVGLQLRRQRITQVILAGLIANLPLECHLRDLLAQGFEVAVVRDAVAGPQLPKGDGYLSALINFRRIANALWTTGQAVKALRADHLTREIGKEYAR